MTEQEARAESVQHKLFTAEGLIFDSTEDHDRHLWDQRVRAERKRQVAKGYTAEHDAEHGVDHLLVWAAEYSRRGEPVKCAALIEAARALVAEWERVCLSSRVVVDDFEGSDNVAAPSKSSQSLSEVTTENSPTLAVHAQAAQFGYTLSSTEAAYIAEAAIVASGLLEEPRVVGAAPSDSEPARHPRYTECVRCGQPGEFFDSPGGTWWSHFEHPEDEHSFEPMAWQASGTSQPVQVEVTEQAVVTLAKHMANVASDWTDICDDDDHPLEHSNWEAYTDDARAALAALGGGDHE